MTYNNAGGAFVKLYEIAKLIRSKNAGPFMLTLDIIFETDEIYNKVVDADILSAELISKLYDVSIEKVEHYKLPLARAIKFSFPRNIPSGGFYDEDVYGAQFHEPLVNLEISFE